MTTEVRRESPDYQPYVAGPFRWRLALRPLELTDWIQIGDDYDHEMDAKARVLGEHYGTVFQALPGTEIEGAEVLLALVDHLVALHPNWFSRDACTVTNHHRGETFAITPDENGVWSEHPLAIAGRLVQEDLRSSCHATEDSCSAVDRSVFPIDGIWRRSWVRAWPRSISRLHASTSS